MDGNEVRRLGFPRLGGYDTAAVDELLDRIAAELDAGRPAAPVIDGATFPRQGIRLQRFRHAWGGYDTNAVDWVLSRLRRQDEPEARADPWRDLLTWGCSMASQDASAAGLAGPAGRAAATRPAAHVRVTKDYARECAQACRDFAAQPGTQLSFVKTGIARWELRTADQYVLASYRNIATRTFDRDGRTYQVSMVKEAQWPAVAMEIGDGLPWAPAHLMSTEPAAPAGEAARGKGRVAGRPRLKKLADPTGPPVLYTAGAHIDGSPGGYVQFPGRRWLRFPVQGTSRSNAIMTAVDQAGRQAARYMIAGRRAIDITVHPDQRLTDELVLTLALTARWVSSFFDSSGGGG